MYTHVAIYDTSTGDFIGYGIKSLTSNKLQTTNIWTDDETVSLNEQLTRLNEKDNLNKTWPHPQDPEVQALLADPGFMPVEMEEQEMVDEDHSHLVWVQEPEVDGQGKPTGRMIDGSDLNREASVINYKRVQVPKRPSDRMLRIKKACERVARQRAGLLEV